MQKSNNFFCLLKGDYSHLKLSNDRKSLFYVVKNCEIDIFCLKFFRVKKKISRCFFDYRLDMLKIVDYCLFRFDKRRNFEDCLVVASKGLVFSRCFFDKKLGDECIFNYAESKHPSYSGLAKLTEQFFVFNSFFRT